MFNRDDLKSVLADHSSPCISLFMHAHRGGAEQDPIRWRKQLVEAEERLVEAGWRAAEVRDMLAPGRRLLEDNTFWNNQSDGLAAFLAPGFLRLYRLPLTFKDLVVIGDRFHIKPLLPLLSGNGRFYVLALSKHTVRLLQGNHYNISEIDLKGVPQNLSEALLTHEAKQPFSFYGRRAGEGPGSWGGIFHGHGVGIDDTKEELLHFFQKVDKGLHLVLRKEKAFLVLAAVDYLQPIYRQANTYPHLLERGVEGNPDRLDSKELHERVWPLVKPHFEEAQQRAAAQYRQMSGTGYTSDDLEAVVAAASEGRVETLFVALDRQQWERFDPSTGRVEQHDKVLFRDVDLLDFAAAQSQSHGRTVYAVKQEQVPSDTGVAAIFCHPLSKHGKQL